MTSSNGKQDPWSRGRYCVLLLLVITVAVVDHSDSPIISQRSSIVALLTEKGAHKVDFRSTTKDDPDWLINLCKQEVEIIQGWLDQYDSDLKQETNIGKRIEISRRTGRKLGQPLPKVEPRILLPMSP